MTAIKTVSLTKKYKDTVAVNELNLEIEKGEFFSLLGVNGAGKTTTIKMLSGIVPPTSGDAFICGHSIVSDRINAKRHINISPQETAVGAFLTVRENLETVCGIYGCSLKEAKERADKTIERFGMEEIQNKRASKLSGGWQRRLSIAMALITEPEIVFLDEPTLGLDVLARRELWSFLENLKGKVTVVLTTHYLEEAQKLSDRIAIMAKGEIKALGTADELIKLSGRDNFENAFVSLCGVEVSK